MLRRLRRHAAADAEYVGDHCELLHLKTVAGIALDVVISGDGRAVDVFLDGVEMTKRHSPDVTNVALEDVAKLCYNHTRNQG